MSPDSKWLVAGRFNGTLSIYDAKSFKETRQVIDVFGVRRPSRVGKMQDTANR